MTKSLLNLRTWYKSASHTGIAVGIGRGIAVGIGRGIAVGTGRGIAG